jgi:hypothetical protein
MQALGELAALPLAVFSAPAAPLWAGVPGCWPARCW